MEAYISKLPGHRQHGLDVARVLHPLGDVHDYGPKAGVLHMHHAGGGQGGLPEDICLTVRSVKIPCLGNYESKGLTSILACTRAEDLFRLLHQDNEEVRVTHHFIELPVVDARDVLSIDKRDHSIHAKSLGGVNADHRCISLT